MLTQHDYQSALDAQSAVNLSVVVHRFAGIMHHISDEACAGNKGTGWKNRHPIVQMFAAHIAYLSSDGKLDNYCSWSEAQTFCFRAARGHHAHLVITVRDNEVLEYEVKGDE